MVFLSKFLDQPIVVFLLKSLVVDTSINHDKSNSHTMWWAKSQRNSQDGHLSVRSISIVCSCTIQRIQLSNLCLLSIMGSIRWKNIFPRVFVYPNLYNSMSWWLYYSIFFWKKIWITYIFIVFIWLFPILVSYIVSGWLSSVFSDPGGRLGGPKGSPDQRPGEAARHLGTGFARAGARLKAGVVKCPILGILDITL